MEKKFVKPVLSIGRIAMLYGVAMDFALSALIDALDRGPY